MTTTSVTTKTMGRESDYERFMERFQMGGSSTSATLVNDTTYGNCCGTCEFCPLA